MSVIVIGMEMPKSCIECPCLRHDSLDGKNAYQCNVTLEKFDIHGLPCSERDEGCPLDHFREVTKNDVSDTNVGNSSEIPNSSDLISRRMQGEDLRKKRVDSFEDAINIINDNTYLNTENVRVILLSEIAGSLAVIADCMTEKKDGDTE